MPNHHPSEFIDLQREELAAMQRELTVVRQRLQEREAELEIARIGAAKLIHALDCAAALTDALTDALLKMAPDGIALDPRLASCKHQLEQAMRAIRR